MNRRDQKVSSQHDEYKITALEKELSVLEQKLQSANDLLQLYKDNNELLLSKLNSVDTLKSLSSLNGLFNSKGFDPESPVVKKYQLYLLQVFEFLLDTAVI